MPDISCFKGSPSGEIVQAVTTQPDPTGQNVQVRVTHSGVCGSDQHFVMLDMVLGHEGAGFVEAVGERVTEFKV